MQVVTRDRLARKVANVDRTKVGNIKVVVSLDKKFFLMKISDVLFISGFGGDFI